VQESKVRALDDLGAETEAYQLAAECARHYEAAGDAASAERVRLFAERMLTTPGSAPPAPAR
jgi:hypothetical protein